MESALPNGLVTLAKLALFVGPSPVKLARRYAKRAWALACSSITFASASKGIAFGWATVTSSLGTQKSEQFRLIGQYQPIKIADDQDPRPLLVAWLRQPDNPFLARAIVNRVWAHYFGRGLVDPVDDLSPLNSPSHPALLQELSQGFVAHKYDLKWLHRTILNSRTYRQSSQRTKANQGDTRN